MPELMVEPSARALNWAALVGRCSFAGNGATYEGPGDPSARFP